MPLIFTPEKRLTILNETGGVHDSYSLSVDDAIAKTNISSHAIPLIQNSNEKLTVSTETGGVADSS